MSEKFVSDVDIDFGDRTQLLSLIKHVSASLKSGDSIRRHNSGIYVTDVPYDPEHDMASILYGEAEERGYIKLDILNVWLYKLIRDESHLIELMKEPNWSLLQDREFFEKLVQIGNHYHTMVKMNEPIDSIPRLAMFISVIRPGKYHLIGKSWKEVGESIWKKDDTGYSFKKSHAIAYAHLVVTHINLLAENPEACQIMSFS